MKPWPIISLRTWVLVTLWVLPLIVYLGVGVLALYKTGWLVFIAWSLPIVWFVAWLVGRTWPPATLPHSRLVQPITPREFWTPQDTAALTVVQQFCSSLPDIDRHSIADPNRYIAMPSNSAKNWPSTIIRNMAIESVSAMTVIEILSVIHLSIEDLEKWMLENIPGSDFITWARSRKCP